MLLLHCGSSTKPYSAGLICRHEVAAHEEPKFLSLQDREAQAASVMLTFKHPAPKMECPADYLQHCRRVRKPSLCGRQASCRLHSTGSDTDKAGGRPHSGSEADLNALPAGVASCTQR